MILPTLLRQKLFLSADRKMINDILTPEFYNTRVKFIEAENGQLVPVQIMVCNRKIFAPGFECRTDSENGNKCSGKKKGQPTEGRTDKAQKRAQAKLRDYIVSNPDMNIFFTLTFSAEKVNREDYMTVQNVVNRWFDNRVRRNGLKYVAVAEYHKDGKSVHYHGLCNECCKLTDSGTIRAPGHKKPIKVATADRYKISDSDRQTVYNISDWCYGFSTALRCTGSVFAVARYIGKYITKQGNNRVGGRYYYHSNNLKEPIYEYKNMDYDKTSGEEIEFTENLHAKFLTVNSDLTF